MFKQIKDSFRRISQSFGQIAIHISEAEREREREREMISRLRFYIYEYSPVAQFLNEFHKRVALQNNKVPF